MCLLLRQKAKRVPKPGKLSYRQAVSDTRVEITDRVMLKPCRTCPGVKALLSRGETDDPREFDGTQGRPSVQRSQGAWYAA